MSESLSEYLYLSLSLCEQSREAIADGEAELENERSDELLKEAKDKNRRVSVCWHIQHECM